MPTHPDRLITLLNLAPHPEGGHYRETFRDVAGPDGRARSTAILFLLKAGEVSRWHRVDAVEVWHWHGGGPLALTIAAPGAARVTLRLGGDVEAGETPQGVVPAHAWQMARPLGDYALVGCTVTPAFSSAASSWRPRGSSRIEGPRASAAARVRPRAGSRCARVGGRPRPAWAG